ETSFTPCEKASTSQRTVSTFCGAVKRELLGGSIGSREAGGAKAARGGFRAAYLMTEAYERTRTRFGIRIRVGRSRRKGFLPRGLEGSQRRAEEVALLIREAFLRGISTR